MKEKNPVYVVLRPRDNIVVLKSNVSSAISSAVKFAHPNNEYDLDGVMVIGATKDEHPKDAMLRILKSEEYLNIVSRSGIDYDVTISIHNIEE
jgi:hypothetical protein